MKAFTYIEKGKFALIEKQKPELQASTDAIVRVTLGSICSSDLHIKHGSVPRAVPGITVGHEMVGVVEEIGSDVKGVKVGDRVTVNVETFCGECFFCKHGYVNNCTSPHGGWALGCRIDGGQTEYVRVPLASQGLNRIPDAVTDEQALFVGDVLATGFWAARISEISTDDTVLIIGAGPTGICTLLCAMLKQPMGCFSMAHSSVQMPVGPAPMMSTVSSVEISLMRAAQNPVASTSPTKSACSSVTASGIRFRPCDASGTRTYSVCPPSMRQPSAQPPWGEVQLFT